MSYLDVVMLILLIAFFAVSKSIKNENSVFDRDSTATIKGLAMLGIVLHHIHNRLLFSSPLLSSIGYLSTAIFFFISGYGNSLSINKNNPNFTWALRKFLKIYIPYFVIYWLYFISNCIFYPTKIPTFKETIQDIFTISLPNEISWFPKIIVLCFILHFLSKKVFSNNKILQCVLTIALLIIYVFFCWKIHLGKYWYNSVLCYPLGMLFATQKNKLLLLFNSQKKKNILLIITIILFGITYSSSFFKWYIQLPCALLFTCICFVYTMQFKIKTKFISWIGNNSFEFYLMHVSCVQIFSMLILKHHYLYTISVILGTILGVFIYEQCKKGLKSITQKPNRI